MHPEPDLAALRALVFVAEEGSISAAAHRLGVSQQAVSLRIRSLESDLHVRLLARSPRGSHLTPSGEVVVGWAATLLAAANEFSGAMDSLRTNQSKTLSVAASLTIAEHLLPEWIARWRSRLGDDGPVATLTAANSRAVIEAVNEGTADLGFIETPAIPTDLSTLTVGVDSIEVVTSLNHPWARIPAISLAELAKTPLILREEGSGTRDALETALEQEGHPLTAEPAAVISTTLGIRSAVMANLAPGALSSLAVSEDVRLGRLARVRVRGLEIKRPLTAIWVGRSPTASAAGFLEAVSRATTR